MAAVLEFECPACGGGLQFSPQSQAVRCPFCETEFSVDALEELNRSKHTVTVEQMHWQAQQQTQWQGQETLQTYVCNSCGGELICDAHTAATSCPYCDNPVVLSGRVSGMLKPDLVIPFQLDKEAAKEALQHHMSGKRLLPKLFKSENRIDRIQGVYVPFWLFDSHADGEIHFHATKVRTWSDSTYQYTNTRHYSIHRAGTVDFEAVPVDGSSKMADELMESIEPYDVSKAVDFQTAYLAGYLADKYDVSSEITVARANERILASTQQAFEDTAVGYSTITQESANIHLECSRVRYALFPVWILTTRYRDKAYTFAMNGQTGKMVGDLPMDKGAYWRWFALITAAATAVAYVLGLLIGG